LEFVLIESKRFVLQSKNGRGNLCFAHSVHFGNKAEGLNDMVKRKYWDI